MKIFGAICVGFSCLLDLLSYYRQIHKTLKTKHSGQVSSTAYVMKILHYLFSLIALSIFCNWVGFGMEFAALAFCAAAFAIVIKFKPKGWRLF